MEDKLYMSINFMMDNKKFFYKRIEYDLLTYLGDIGGLYGALEPICIWIIGYFMKNGIETFLMSDLFSV